MGMDEECKYLWISKVTKERCCIHPQFSYIQKCDGESCGLYEKRDNQDG